MTDAILKCCKKIPWAKIPTKNYEHDASYDIYSVVDADIDPHTIKPVPTGIAIKVPVGYYYTIDCRSGLSFNHEIDVVRNIIDANYIGEIFILLRNNGSHIQSIRNGDRIAQITLHKVIKSTIVEVQEFDIKEGERGLNGYGSSGR